MPSISLRRYGVLEDAERAERPQTIRRLTYDEVAAPDSAFRASLHQVATTNPKAS